MVIVGGGPAGLTAAHELVTRGAFTVEVLEQSQALGGISQTVNYRGNRIDIGGHRFFSKIDRVMDFWLDKLPLQALDGREVKIAYHNQHTAIHGAASGPDPLTTEQVMLLRNRISRIYHRRNFFAYPIRLDLETLWKLGVWRTWRIGWSYLRSVAFPVRPELNLEHFFINRFGRELYTTFFKDYTEKVWGTACENISAEWGAQRIKGLSVTKAIAHFFRGLLRGDKKAHRPQAAETSLIEQFLYPKLGPGQMWEETARRVEACGGRILRGWQVVRVHHSEGCITRIVARATETGEERSWPVGQLISSMPVRDLVLALEPPAPTEVHAVAEGLLYRDFITVGLLVDRLAVTEKGPKSRQLIKDNWIYVQEPDVQVGRLQIFNNWSPAMVADEGRVWLGLEYFANEGDPLWQMDDDALKALGEDELIRIGLLEPGVVKDACVIRMPKAYPGYFGTYGQFGVIREYLDRFANLWLVGRNGMHRYNNQDHSMLTAMLAADQILAGERDAAALWAVNTEEEYHETRASDPAKI